MTEATLPELDRRYVSALGRGLQLLQCFRHGEKWLSHQELTQRSRLPKATVSRLVFTLTAAGFMRHDAGRGMYSLGPGGLALGFRTLANFEVASLARPFLEELAATSQAAVSIGLRHQLQMVYIAHARGHSRLTLSLDVGARIPIETTSMGRAYLCALPAVQRDVLLAQARVALGDRWTSVKAGLQQAQAQYRQLGFVTCEGEWESDVSAVGATIHAPHGGDVYAISIGGPSTSLTHERLLRQLGPRLAEAAREIEAALQSAGEVLAG